MRKNTLHPQIEVLLDAIDLAFDHRAWHGPNLRGAIRHPDTLARLGGDEFMIIATDLPSDQPADLIARTSATRIAHALHRAVNINGNALNVTGSIGVAVYPDDTTDEVLLRRLADQRMYEQKRQIPFSF